MFADRADGTVDERYARSGNFGANSTDVDPVVEKSGDILSTACGESSCGEWPGAATSAVSASPPD
jgi:hypothetical protein